MTPQHYTIEEGKLYGGEYPGMRLPASAKERLRSLIDKGVRTFIDLTDPEDGMAPYEGLLEELANETGTPLQRISLPVPDMGTPTTANMREIMSAIRDSIEQSPAVYVHCWGGIGRTGTVVGCWFRECGYLQAFVAPERRQQESLPPTELTGGTVEHPQVEKRQESAEDAGGDDAETEPGTRPEVRELFEGRPGRGVMVVGQNNDQGHKLERQARQQVGAGTAQAGLPGWFAVGGCVGHEEGGGFHSMACRTSVKWRRHRYGRGPRLLGITPNGGRRIFVRCCQPDRGDSVRQTS